MMSQSKPGSFFKTNFGEEAIQKPMAIRLTLRFSRDLRFTSFARL